MKKIYLATFLLLGLITTACTENERLTYDPAMHDIYYNIVTDTRDSLYFSLLTAEDVSTRTITIKLMGHALQAPERFAIEVVPEKTTAQEGVHYQRLPEYYEFPAGVFTYDMPITLIKTDPALKEEEKVLALRLKSISNLGVAYPDKAVLKVQFSDMLKKPAGTGYYGDMTAFISLFGEYSKTKHMMIIELTGHDFWDGDYGVYGGDYGIFYEKGYYTPWARKLYQIITTGTYYDENDKLMTGWNVP